MAGTQGIVRLSAVGLSAWIPINLNAFKFGVGLLVTMSSGASLTYNVRCTGDRLTDPANLPGTQTNNLHDILFSKTASANSSLAYPCSAVQLQITVYGSGSATLAVVQQSGG